MKRLLAVAMALSALTGTVALADSDRRDRGHHERRWYDDNGRRSDHRHGDNRHGDTHWNDRHYVRGFQEYGWRTPHPRYRVVRYSPPRGYRYYPWHPGARLPVAYYAPRYVISDYGYYRLRPPPRGYHWVRVDNDVVLAAIVSGLVVQVVNGIFY
jgi:Ni/Co efflux regulator RcnB